MQHRHLMYMYMYIMIYHTIGSTESQTRTEPDGVPPEEPPSSPTQQLEVRTIVTEKRKRTTRRGRANTVVAKVLQLFTYCAFIYCIHVHNLFLGKTA